MITTGIESRVKIQDIVSNQVPSFIQDESPKFLDFLKQYYISQEYQGGPVDLSQNLDQYLKLDNLKPEVVVGSTTSSGVISISADVITVADTTGFPEKYGLLKIDDEIITYTEKTSTSFLNCVRGFSGVTNYSNEFNESELVFSSTQAASHSDGATVENLSSLFLKEFYEKTKSTFAYGFEGKTLVEELDVGNFLKEVKSFYESKGTDDSIETLIKVLFGDKGESINLEDFLLKPSDANFIRREIVIVEAISGNVLALKGQTIFKNTDSETRAVVSETEIFTRRNKTYYKLYLYVGYDDRSSIEGTFEITPSTKSLEKVEVGSSSIPVDSTVGFPNKGKIFSGNNVIEYTDRSINQFLGCTGITNIILPTDNVRSEKSYYGFEDGDASKKCEFRITGVVSNIIQEDNDVIVSEGQHLTVGSLGDLVRNPRNKNRKEIFANSWIYNTSPSVDVKQISDGTILLESSIDKSQFKVGDRIEILDKASLDVLWPEETTNIPNIVEIPQNSDGFFNTVIVTSFDGFAEKYLDPDFNSNGEIQNPYYVASRKFVLRRRVNKAFSKNVPIQYGNYNIISDIQNLYTEGEEFAYVASNSLPSSSLEEDEFSSYENSSYVYDIKDEIYRYTIDSESVGPLQDLDSQTLESTGSKLYTSILFEKKVRFLTGDRVFYQPSERPLVGLGTGSYYVEVLSDSDPNLDKRKIRLYTSRSHISSSLDSLKFFSEEENIVGSHEFTLYAHRSNTIAPQKLFKKFPLNPNLKSGTFEKTKAGSTGMLINGVEIKNYKTQDKVYYGPLEGVNVLNSGSGYDVIKEPRIQIDSPENGTTSVMQSVVSGSIQDFIIESTDFDIDKIISINVTGGNGSGGVFNPILVSKKVELLFDARSTTDGGGIDTSTFQLTFIKDHNLLNGQVIQYRNTTQHGDLSIDVYDSNGGLIQDSGYLTNNASYFVRVDNSKTVKLYENYSDYLGQNNPVSFGTTSGGGIQKFVVGDSRTTLSEIKILDGGTFTNRKLKVSASGINTFKSSIEFKNHNFNDGDLITYSYDDVGVGLSTEGVDHQYYVLKESNDSFKLSDAGIGGTVRSNYESRNYVGLETSTGNHFFKYPKIEASVDFVAVGLGTTTQNQSITLTPVIKGSIIDAYIYDPGSGYGSDILNFEQTPNVKVLKGEKGQISPTIVSGLIIDANIQFGGFNYFSPPELEVVDPEGSGNGAKLIAIVSDQGTITGVKVIRSGSGYSQNTKINVVNSGKNAIFSTSIRSLEVNNVEKIPEKQHTVLVESGNNLQYSISGYFDGIQESFGDYGLLNSGIIGWAYDGNPIYGPYAPTDPEDINSIKKRLVSGYVKDSSNIVDRPSQQKFPLGFFVDDYRFNGEGDLDRNNGRFAKTKDYPNGVYAYHAVIDGNNIPVFPYFIGESYRTNTLKENLNLSQYFDFNSSKLLRNTLPYKTSEVGADYNFIVETNEIKQQQTIVNDVFSGPIENIDIIQSGDGYKVGEKLVFDNTDTEGGGVEAEISLIKGKHINEINYKSVSFDNATLIWNNSDTLKIVTNTNHEFTTGDYVVFSGISTSSSLKDLAIRSLQNSFERITVKEPIKFVLSEDISPSTATTEIYVSNVPNEIGIGNSIQIGSEYLTVLNTYPNKNILRVSRGNASLTHQSGIGITSLNYEFFVDKKSEYFDSRVTSRVYFNPHESIGVGINTGDGYDVSFGFGSTTISRSIPTGRIYLENHSLKTNDKVVFNLNGNSGISTYISGPNGAISDLDEFYVVNKSPNTISLKTSLSGEEILFATNGDDSDLYYLETLYGKETVDVEKITATVSVSTYHGLRNNDSITLSLESNLNVGVGTSTSVSVTLNQGSTIGINTILASVASNPTGSFGDSAYVPWVFTTSPQKHNFKTGDKVVYTHINYPTYSPHYGKGTFGSGANDPEMQNVGFYVNVVNETDFTVSETYDDAFKSPIRGDTSLGITLLPGSDLDPNQLDGEVHTWTLVNPRIEVVKGNNLVFDLSDTSLSGNDFKIYYDKEFNNEFISVGNTSVFNVVGAGTVGVTSTATLTANHSSENFPEKLYYNLENSSTGTFLLADTEQKNYNEIRYVDSKYSGKHIVSGVVGVASTSFEFNLRYKPERDAYTQEECNILSYVTSSPTASGGVNSIDITHQGENYKKLPKITGISTGNGNGLSVSARSEIVGSIKNVTILNEGFEYSSDRTLLPKTFIAPNILLRRSNVLESIEIVDGGSNYVSPPVLTLVDFNTREKITGGSLEAVLLGGSISEVVVDNVPYGLGESSELFVENNTNGISIVRVDSNNTGIFTCSLTTPQGGFEEENKLKVGDLVYLEGIQKYSEEGSGFNSSEYGYKFFKVISYTEASSDLVTLDVSDLTSNTGIAKTIQDSTGVMIAKDNYPLFNVKTKISTFSPGEKLSVNNNPTDLIVESHTNNENLKVFGSYELAPNEKLTGRNSGNIAFIEKITTSTARYDVGFSIEKDLGWKYDTGKLSEDHQVLPDNDYYQNMSYSIKSPRTWDEIKGPLNNLVHVSGMKNFANCEILSETKNINSDGVNNAFSDLDIFLDIIGENRVDTIYNFDSAKDIDVINNSSRFMEFKDTIFLGYVEAKKNSVLRVDDISKEFSQFETTPLQYVNILEIDPKTDYSSYTFKLNAVGKKEIQLTSLNIISDLDGNGYILEQDSLSNSGAGTTHVADELYGEFNLVTTEFEETFLRFTPKDAFTTEYDIKYFEKKFGSSSTGIGTTSVGFIDLVSVITGVSTGIGIGTIFTLDSTKYSSFLADIHLNTKISQRSNFAQLYVTHDGTNTRIAEYRYDTSDVDKSLSGIGTFTPVLDGGNLKLEYENDEDTETVIVRARVCAFGDYNNPNQEDVYRYSVLNQPAGNERSGIYTSTHSSTTISNSPISVLSLPKFIFDASKSVVELKLQQPMSPVEVEVHTISLIHDVDDTYIQENGFISLGENTEISSFSDPDAAGIGTFGSRFDGSDNFELLFYPDSSYIGSSLEINALSDCFYTDIDTINEYPPLQFGPSVEKVDHFSYLAISGSRINRTNFVLRENKIPIFAKTFDPGNPQVAITTQGKFNIENHFFSDKEELVYTPRSTFIGVGESPMRYVDPVTSTVQDLPTTVYARLDNYLEYDSFKLSITPNGPIIQEFDDIGEGNAHRFEMKESLSKAIITIDGMIQSPIASINVSHTLQGNGGSISTQSTTFALSGIQTVNVSDILKIDDEYMKVVSVGLGTVNTGPVSGTGTIELVSVERAILGSTVDTHSDGTGIATVFKGSYNIVGDEIHFVDPPRGNASITRTENNLVFQTSEFSGRVFLRGDYASNKIYDDVSHKFDGITRTFTLAEDGDSGLGIGTDGGNGIVLINGIYQTPSAANNPNNNFEIIEDSTVGPSGISSVRFTGYRKEDGSVGFSKTDVNANQIPRGGIIVSLGSSGGLGYAPLVGAAVTAVISGGVIQNSIGLGATDNVGSGYNGIVSIGVSVFDPLGTGSGAVITASPVTTVGAGGSLTFNVINGGGGYSDQTRIYVSEPSYSNLEVIGVSRVGLGIGTETGIGLLMDIEVGAASTTVGVGSTAFDVKGFKIKRPGYSFRKGDKFRPVGLVTAAGLTEPIEEITFEVVDVFNDKFSAWQFGKIDFIDSIKNFQDGSRVRFPISYNASLFSVQKAKESRMDIQNSLIIFVNGVLQNPGENYTFDGGSSFVFTEPPRPDDQIAIFFYRGSTGDDEEITSIFPSVEIGDKVQIDRYFDLKAQEKRTVFGYKQSDTLETEPYYGVGIYDDTTSAANQFRPVIWEKQKVDLTLGGVTIPKTRGSLISQNFPIGKVVKDVASTDTEIYVDNVDLFKYEGNNNKIVVYGNENLIPAEFDVTVSAAGTISNITVNTSNPGSGYTSTDGIIELSISAPSTIREGWPQTVPGSNAPDINEQGAISLPPSTAGIATAIVTVGAGGTLVGIVTIGNDGGSGYSTTTDPHVFAPLHQIDYAITENDITGAVGFSGNITRVQYGDSSTGDPYTCLIFTCTRDYRYGTGLDFDGSIANNNNLLNVGDYITVFNTRVGNGVTSAELVGGLVGDAISVGTSYLNNVYKISGYSFTGPNATIVCAVLPQSDLVGLVNDTNDHVGEFSWGKINLTDPIGTEISVPGTVSDDKYSDFPTVVRKTGGLRGRGALIERKT